MNNAGRIIITAILMLAADMAIAEPGVSTKYLPLVWIGALAICAVGAWLISGLIAKLADVKSRRYRWGVAVTLFVVFAIFIAPFFVVLGSVMITGRTM